MIKKGQSIIFLTMIFFLLSACQPPANSKNVETNAEMKAETQTIPTSKNDLKLLIKKADISTSEDNVEITIQNNSSIEYMYGEDFHVEKRIKKTWYSVPFDDYVTFDDIGLVIQTNTSRAQSIPLKKLKNFKIELSPGEYRIVKSFFPSEQTPSKKNTVLLAVQFKIK
ncbi:immunoglobulin-like domain-containing protein [Metabacillus fastidiosus]|uniref:immunoglobulin-like domain-containing protein n=1 Tax=Metabacillus fastidiosus TaxID=1458 RepID=UPI003D2AD53F